MASVTSKPFMDVLNGRAPARRPVWFMRQAGRYLPEYRKVRDQAGSFLNLCFDADLASEVTLQPLRRFDLDAAIIFSDILIVPHAMGLPLAFVEGEGPVLAPVASAEDVRRLKTSADRVKLESIANALTRTKPYLPPHAALIGFSGAPWTVATYMVEGRSSDRTRVLAVVQARPQWFLDLIAKVTETTIGYLSAQVDAGADALQIFDSWAGGLEGPLLDEFCIKPIAAIIAGVRSRHPNIPIIVFARGAGLRHADVLKGTGASAISVEQEQDLANLAAVLPPHAIIQGNLDPAALLLDELEMKARARAILASVPKRRHIFNLGHGIHQTTEPDMVAAAVEAVRAFDAG
jgi:uroporphyrinogen decarboxylase